MIMGSVVPADTDELLFDLRVNENIAESGHPRFLMLVMSVPSGDHITVHLTPDEVKELHRVTRML